LLMERINPVRVLCPKGATTRFPISTSSYKSMGTAYEKRESTGSGKATSINFI